MLYTVTVRDANNCTSSTSVTLTEPAVLAATTTSTDVKCFGGNDGSATVETVTGGTTPYAYTWPQGGHDSDTTGLRYGTYTVTITDAHACSITRSISIGQPSAISTGIVATSPICAGTTTTLNLTVSGGTPGSPTAYTYSWIENATPAIVIATTEDITAGAGAYTVTVTDGNLCTATATTTITNYATPTITTNEVPQVCLNTPFIVTATSTQSGDWSAQAYKASTNAAVGAPQTTTGSLTMTYNHAGSAVSDTVYIVYTFTSSVGSCVYRDTTNDIKMSGEPRLRIYRNSTEDNYATINANQPVSFHFMVDNTCNTDPATRLAIMYTIYKDGVPVTNITDYVTNSNSVRYQMPLTGTGLEGYYPPFNYTSTLSQAPGAHFPLATSSGAVLGSDQFDFFSLAYFTNREGTISISNFTEAGVYTIEYALITNYNEATFTTQHGNQIGVMTSLTPAALGGNQFFTGTYYTRVWSTNTMTITVNPGSGPAPELPIAEKPVKPEPQMRVYPNPSQPGQLVYVEVENMSGDAVLTVSAVNGSVVDKTQVTITENQKQFSYNLKNVVPGVYFVTLTTKDAVITKKVVVQPR